MTSSHRMFGGHSCQQIGSSHENPSVRPGPMGNAMRFVIRVVASLIVLNRRHPEQAFRKYIDQTDHHLMVSEPRLADGTIARLWPHVNTIWADDAFMALSFLVRMGEVTGDTKYFDDAANQTGSHRAIIIQAFIPVNHVPIHMVHGSPTFLLQCLVIQAMEVVLVYIVENEIHILQNIILVLRST